MNYSILLIALVLNLLGTLFCEATCGQRPSGARIVGGQTASPNSWPWQLSLQDKGSHTCGASLLNGDWALTAAHCVAMDPTPSRYSIMAGGHHIKNEDGRGQIVAISKIISHKGFRMWTLRHDVALLKLSQPVQFSSTVNTVCLPKQGQRPKPGATCFISGWGRHLGGYVNKLPTYLQQAKVPIVDTQKCSEGLGTIHESSMICIGGAGSVSCDGDSGGPLVCEEGGQWVLYGASSWGRPACTVDNYAVYARVSSYIDWIKRKTGGSVIGGTGGGTGGGTDGGAGGTGSQAVNGGYGKWGNWGRCSKTCGGGVRRRSRSCTNPRPSNGGKDCSSLGHASQTQSCNREACSGPPATCGRRPSGSRIVGGQTAKPNSWPWQLLLLKRGYPKCGASLINNLWAVTAAHCVDGPKARYSVMAGGHHRYNDDNRGTILYVDKVILHEKYSTSHSQNDVALLKLSTPVSLSSKIGTVCLPDQGEMINSKATCWVTGWGRDNGITGSKPTYLQQSEVPLVGHDLCKKVNGPEVHEPSMVCVGGAGSSVCNGDSGGPLVCEAGGRWVLHGTASWVSDAACPVDKYSVFARVSSYIDWIKEKIANNGGEGGGAGGGQGSCVDKGPSCGFWGRRCYSSVAKERCRKTCKLC